METLLFEDIDGKNDYSYLNLHEIRGIVNYLNSMSNSCAIFHLANLGLDYSRIKTTNFHVILYKSQEG
jgi:hypothetical protein